MTTPSFGDVLDMNLADAVPPVPLPIGNYTWQVGKLTFGNANNENKTPFAQFDLKMMDPRDGVDREKLAEVDLSKLKDNNVKLWLTPDAAHRARDFIEKCGVDITDMGMRQGLEECVGKMVVGAIEHNPSNRPGDSTIYANVAGISQLND